MWWIGLDNDVNRGHYRPRLRANESCAHRRGHEIRGASQPSHSRDNGVGKRETWIEKRAAAWPVEPCLHGELLFDRRVACALPATICKSSESVDHGGWSAGSAFSEGKYAERRCSAGGNHQGRDDHTPSDTRTRGRSGLCQVLQPRRDRSVRRGRVGCQVGRHRQREGAGGLRAARRRDASLLVAAGNQHRRLEVFPRTDRHAGARAQRQAAHRPRRRHDHGVGAQAELLRERRRPAGVQRRSEAPPRLSEGRVQQPRVVQRRVRESPAVLGVLHQRRPGHDGVDPRPGQDRGHALQVRIRHRVRTCRTSARRASCSPAAGRRRGLCLS